MLTKMVSNYEIEIITLFLKYEYNFYKDFSENYEFSEYGNNYKLLTLLNNMIKIDLIFWRNIVFNPKWWCLKKIKSIDFRQISTKKICQIFESNF